MVAPTNRELFTGLLRELRSAGPLGRLRLLGRGVGALRQLSPWDRKMLLRMAGFEGAEDLIERLAAGDPETADRLQKIVAEVERDPDRAQEAVRALADPHRRGDAIDSLIRTLDRAVETERPEPAEEPGEPEEAEEPETAAKTPPRPPYPPASGEKPFPELERGEARPSGAGGTATRTAGGAATAAAAGVAAARAAGTGAPKPPEHAPAPPKAGPRPSPPPAAPPGTRRPEPPSPSPSASPSESRPPEPGEAPVPAPAPATEPPVVATPAAPAPLPSPEPSRTPQPVPEPVTDPGLVGLSSGPLFERSGHAVLTGLLDLRSRLARGEEVTADALRRLLREKITPPWARRRALSAWIEAPRPGQQVDLDLHLDRALALIGELESPGDRTWCLASLAASHRWPPGAWEQIVAAAPDDAARRRIEHRRAA